MGGGESGELTHHGARAPQEFFYGKHALLVRPGSAPFAIQRGLEHGQVAHMEGVRLEGEHGVEFPGGLPGAMACVRTGFMDVHATP